MILLDRHDQFCTLGDKRVNSRYQYFTYSSCVSNHHTSFCLISTALFDIEPEIVLAYNDISHVIPENVTCLLVLVVLQVLVYYHTQWN